MTRFSAPLILGLALVAFACNENKPGPTPATAETTKANANTAEAPKEPGAAEPKPEAEAKPKGIAVGQPAPDFELKDMKGESVKLSSYKGKVVVLEWFNPGCPYVKASHTKGSLVGAAKKHTEGGGVWLTINSAAEGKQGASMDENKQAAEQYGFSHPLLFDAEGTVGKQYGATHTPHMFVINEEGTVVYAGAIDNSPDGAGESPKGGTLVNHVAEALKDIAEKKPVRTPETEAYGCSVKYKS
ncbi:MAG: thioredoxin family protein [Polyangiaceae bacterium]|nr:thioredoxin family protein [Polyangiaceae bacterium]